MGEYWIKRSFRTLQLALCITGQSGLELINDNEQETVLSHTSMS